MLSFYKLLWKIINKFKNINNRFFTEKVLFQQKKRFYGNNYCLKLVYKRVEVRKNFGKKQFA